MRGRPIKPSFPEFDGKKMTQEIATMLWAYNAATGLWTWKVSPRFGIEIGDAAGVIDNHGYRMLTFRGKKYKASRMAWLVMKGYWPKEVDHKDRNRANDKWCNLREATSSQNKCNIGTRKDNVLGVKGVSECPDGRYAAYICVRGHRKNLGRFQTIAEAKAAYDAASVKWHGEFRRAA